MPSPFVRRVVAALVTGAALVAVSLPTEASHSWGGYHWARKANPFTLKLGNNMTTATAPCVLRRVPVLRLPWFCPILAAGCHSSYSTCHRRRSSGQT